MSGKLIKHKKKISFAVITAYLFLFIFNIIHYHSIDIQNNKLSLNNLNEQTKTSSFQYYDQRFKCTFHLNYTSLHNYTSSNHQIFSVDLYKQEIPFLEKTPHYINSFSTGISLRAPPEILL